MLKRLNKDQNGMVSITVVIIIMFLLTLVVLAFAKLVRREQRQSLDRQLNTQAFYAAETGVNDVVNALKNNATLADTDYTDCSAFVNAAYLTPSMGDGTTSYSCVLVDNSPKSLTYDNVDTTKSQVVPIQDKSGAAINTIKIAWESVDAGANFGGCSDDGANFNFPDTWPSYCDAGVLRVDIVPFSAGIARDQLATLSGVVYLLPVGSSQPSTIGFGTLGGTPASMGNYLKTNCSSGNSPRACVATISGLGATKYYLRLKSIYKANKVTVSANGGTAELKGAQAVIDVTGRANDVLRRIQVSVPIFTSDAGSSEYAVETSQSFCKRLKNDGATVSVVSPGASDSAACDPTQ